MQAKAACRKVSAEFPRDITSRKLVCSDRRYRHYIRCCRCPDDKSEHASFLILQRTVFSALLLSTLIAPAMAATLSPPPQAPYVSVMPQESSLLLSSPTAAANAQGQPPPPALLILGAIGLSENYATNAGGAQNTAVSRSDTYTRGNLDLGLRYQGSRLNIAANYELTGNYYDRFHQLDRVENRLNLSSEATLIPQNLFLNVSAFATPIILSRIGAISPNAEPIASSSSRDTYGYTAEPQLVLHFDDFATSTTTINQSGVFLAMPSTSNSGVMLPFSAAQNTLSTLASEQITSGSTFSRLQWNLNGSYSNIDQTSQSERQSEGFAKFRFAVDRVITLEAVGGYDNYKASMTLTRKLSGPIVMGGFHFSYGPTFLLHALAGTQHNFSVYTGSLHWNLTPIISADASLTDQVTTPQSDIIANLTNLSVMPNGAFSNGPTANGTSIEQALFPNLSTVSPVSNTGLALDNSLNRDRTAHVSLSLQELRTTYTLGAYGEKRDRLDSNLNAYSPNSSLYGAVMNVRRSLSTNLTGFAALSYSFADEFGGHDRLIQASLGVAYDLNQNLSIYISDEYLDRQMQGTVGAVLAPVSDDEITIGIRQRF